MHDLFPIALRALKDNNFIDVMWALSILFKELCVKELTIKKLDEAGANACVMLCRMKKLFPPGSFTVMVHLIVHLTEKAKLGGLVLYRLMYLIERLEFTF